MSAAAGPGVCVCVCVCVCACVYVCVRLHGQRAPQPRLNSRLRLFMLASINDSIYMSRGQRAPQPRLYQCLPLSMLSSINFCLYSFLSISMTVSVYLAVKELLSLTEQPQRRVPLPLLMPASINAYLHTSVMPASINVYHTSRSKSSSASRSSRSAASHCLY